VLPCPSREALRQAEPFLSLGGFVKGIDQVARLLHAIPDAWDLLVIALSGGSSEGLPAGEGLEHRGIDPFRRDLVFQVADALLVGAGWSEVASGSRQTC
jgi:hypothetical protein